MLGLLRARSRWASPSISGLRESSSQAGCLCNALLIRARRQKAKRANSGDGCYDTSPPVTTATTQRRDTPEKAVHPNSSTRKFCPKLIRIPDSAAAAQAFESSDRAAYLQSSTPPFVHSEAVRQGIPAQGDPCLPSLWS